MAKIIAVVVAALLFFAFFLVPRMLGVTIDLPVSDGTILVIILLALVLVNSLQGDNRPSRQFQPLTECPSDDIIRRTAKDDIELEDVGKITDHIRGCVKCRKLFEKESNRILRDERLLFGENHR